jgi:hypothetical protein
MRSLVLRTAVAMLCGASAVTAQTTPGKYLLAQVNHTAVPAMYQDSKGANWSVLDGWIELYKNGSWMLKLNCRDPRGRKRSTVDFGNYTPTADGFDLTSTLAGSFRAVVSTARLEIAYDVDADRVAENLQFGRSGAQAAPQAPLTTATPAPAAPQAAPPTVTAPAGAGVRSVGDMSFAVPPGWSYQPPTGDRPAKLALGSGDDAVVISLFGPARSSGNAESDFAAAWSRVVGTTPPEPYSHENPVGYPGKYGGFAETPYARLYVLNAGTAAIPVLVGARDRGSFDDHSVAISGFVEGIRVAPLRAEPVKTAITIADLAGEWTSGGESSVNYVTSSGAYAGSSTVAHAATYVIAADGTFRYRFAGVSNRQTVRGEGTGRVELANGTLTFQEQGRSSGQRYSIIAYQRALSGATVLTLLDAQYPTTGINVAFYGEKWIRAEAAAPVSR